jgi:hypothetical protein
LSCTSSGYRPEQVQVQVQVVGDGERVVQAEERETEQQLGRIDLGSRPAHPVVDSVRGDRLPVVLVGGEPEVLDPAPGRLAGNGETRIGLAG